MSIDTRNLRAHCPNWEGDSDAEPTIALARDFNEHTIAVYGIQGKTNATVSGLERAFITSVVAMWNAGLLDVRNGKVWLHDEVVDLMKSLTDRIKLGK